MNALIPSASTAPRSLRHTVFFGILPPVSVARRTRDLAEDLTRSGQTSGSLRPQRVLHVSLMLIGKELAEPPPARLIQSLRAFGQTVKQRPFTICLNRVEAWGRPGAKGPVVTLGDDGVVGVEGLHRRLAEALGAVERPDFSPHMTLLYGRGPSAPMPIPPITWPVREFVLIHSLVGLSRYEILGRFPLLV
jgi:2'-5' RNA ligase